MSRIITLRLLRTASTNVGKLALTIGRAQERMPELSDVIAGRPTSQAAAFRRMRRRWLATLGSEHRVELYTCTSQALGPDTAPCRSKNGRDDCDHLSLIARSLPESPQ